MFIMLYLMTIVFALASFVNMFFLLPGLVCAIMAMVLEWKQSGEFR